MSRYTNTSQSSSESEDSFEHVDVDSVISLDSWNNVGNAAPVPGVNENNGGSQSLEQEFNVLNLDDDGSLFSLEQTLQDNLAAISLENLPAEPQPQPSVQLLSDDLVLAVGSRNALCEIPPDPSILEPSAVSLSGRSSSQVDNLGGRLDALESLVQRSSAAQDEGAVAWLAATQPREGGCGSDDIDSVHTTAAVGNASNTHTGGNEGDPNSPNRAPLPVARVWGTCGNADSRLAEEFSPPGQLIFNGTFEQARMVANAQSKLLLVSLQDYDSFGSFAVNRDVFSLEQFQALVPDRYVFIQLTTGSKEGTEYAAHFQVQHFPHLGILHPEHGSMLWGVDGWSPERAWEPGTVIEALVDWGYRQFSQEHHERMEVDEDPDEELLIDPITDVNQELLLQEAMFTSEIDLDDPEAIENFFAIQSAMLSA